MAQCRICSNTELKTFLSLGKTPLANSFLSKDELAGKESTFPLELCFCPKCKLVQLTHIVPAEIMFKDYVYVSSTTLTFQLHFAKMAEDISKDFGLNENSLVVDIGSNDGLLLKGFQKMKVKTIGVEPAANIARLAEQNGIETINDFFNSSSVNEIIKRKGHADIAAAANVFAHVDNIREFAKNVKCLLKKDGVFIIEIQYFVDTLEKMNFDNVYHEHLSYFTLTSLKNFFERDGMKVFKAQRVNSHGGSLRVFVKKMEGKYETDDSVYSTLKYEKGLGIENFKTYEKFADSVNEVKTELIEYVDSIKSRGKNIAGYGAPAKGNTLLNFCGIGKDCIDYIIEDNPLKQGLFAPGTHIPVVSPSMLDEKTPDYVLILAWNFADEILKKTKKYAETGVRFIIPLPKPRIV